MYGLKALSWNRISVYTLNNSQLMFSFSFFLALQKSFSVSHRSEQQVRFLCAAGSGVWASCRLDPTLRLFDWTTGRPLQEVDVSSIITKALGKLYNFFVNL